jgi:hypothetical protein
MFNRCSFLVHYNVIRHETAVTATETAKKLHCPGAAIVKAVVVKIDNVPALCVLRGDDMVALEQLEKLAGVESVELASPADLRRLFPNVQVRPPACAPIDWSSHPRLCTQYGERLPETMDLATTQPG